MGGNREKRGGEIRGYRIGQCYKKDRETKSNCFPIFYLVIQNLFLFYRIIVIFVYKKFCLLKRFLFFYSKLYYYICIVES